ncbi:YlbD family protein [Evansella tamaricis]|uniref:YlbD family protein n=1 Tax=Evansella tamaricis TaxID=2069301 RepID=A0ABS6JC58_9BACI|nr:YlbD family protein [Evansella tamaricis]MBU9711246.1 YlbD family protein [Evansella tamaricis]
MASSHPDVRKFKLFVKNNPHVLKDVKTGDKTLQDLFEEYILFGEEDEIWDTYREKKSAKGSKKSKDKEKNTDAEQDEGEEDEEKEESSTTQDLLALLKKVNFNDLQSSLSQFSGVLASVQELLGQFRSPNNPNSPPPTNNQQQNSPFSYNDD